MRIAILLLMLYPSLAWSAVKDAEFDGDQYGRVNLFNKQMTRTYEAVLDGRPNYELLQQYGTTDRLRQLSRPVGRLDVMTRDNGMSVCTASIISDRHILTNNHCIPGKGVVVAASILMNYYSTDNEQVTRRYEVDPNPVETSAALDYSILLVKGNPAREFGTIRIAARDPAAGEALLILHHPGGRPKYVTRGGCLATSPDPLSGNEILHRCDTLPGSSGSPVLSESDGRVIGLHFAGMAEASARMNFAKRMSSVYAASAILRSIVLNETTTTGPIHLGGGRMYVGELRAGWPEGRGILTDANGTKYEGQFVNGQPEGTTRITYADGVVNSQANFKRGIQTGLNFCNKTPRTTHISIAYYYENKWISQGWWGVESKTCRILFENPSQRYYYWRATSQDLIWGGDKYSFCTHDRDVFKYDNSIPCIAGAQRRGYHDIDLNGQAGWTHNLTE